MAKQCPTCNSVFNDPITANDAPVPKYCDKCSTLTPLIDYQAEAAAEAASLDLFDDFDIPYTLDPTKYQYKVITQKDRFFSSKFNPAQLERALNEYAQEGWTFKAAVTADFGQLGMSRNELVMFLEKEPNG